MNNARLAEKTLQSAKNGHRISTKDTQNLINHIDRGKLNDDDKELVDSLEQHHNENARDPNHDKTEANPYNGNMVWRTIAGHHILINAGERNYNLFFKNTDGQGKHFATVNRRTDRPDGTATAGDKRDFKVDMDSKAHPPDPTRAEQDKNHNLVTVYQGKDEDGNDKFRRVNLHKLNGLYDKRYNPKTFER